MKRIPLACLLLFLLVPTHGARAADSTPHIPDWAKSAVWYQIFPERFCNADAANDPTRETLEYDFPNVPGWRVTPWTGDFYARDGWEKAWGDDFYETGVFARRYGGDLQGVIDRLDYLQNLGVNAIYFNPVFYARSLHKYDGNTYHHIDPNFGPDPAGDFKIIFEGGETADPATWKWTAADKLFLELVKQAHARGIRVVIDGVFNHTGRDFFAFRDIRINGAKSPYADWYTITSFDDPATRRNEFRYRGWAGFYRLPEFSDTKDGSDLHPGPKKYIFDATKRWMDPDGDGNPDDGIDGWRLDVANELPDKFWRDWNAHVFAINPRALTVPELWDDSSDYLRRTGFSVAMNYWAFAKPVKGFLIDNGITPSQFGDALDERRAKLPLPVQMAMWNMVDSHDTPRLAQMIVNRNTTGKYRNPANFDYGEPGTISARDNDQYRVSKPGEQERGIQRLVALFQAAYIGAPMIYYGTEAGMWGGQDPDCRKPMPWPDLKMDAEKLDPRARQRPEDDANFDETMHDFYQSVLALHADTPAFRSPEFAVLPVDDAQNVFLFSRGTGADLRVVALNRSESAQTVPLAAPVGEVIFTTNEGAGTSISKDGGKVELTLPPLTGAVLK